MKKVFVSGCFDILHGGHVEFFTQAKALGDHLTVCFANDEVLFRHKNKKSSLPIGHKKRLIESFSMVDEVVVGEDLEPGLDFKSHLLRLKPDILAVTEDDQYGRQKRQLCRQIGTKYVILPKSLNFQKISTTEIINYIKAPQETPLRVDFAGGWTDVPKYARSDSWIVNCTITPTVSLNHWPYEVGSGLGGSAAYSILAGKNGLQSELDLGVGWQDPAVIAETGLCVWKSGPIPKLEFKINPEFLTGRLALLWTGNNHTTYKEVNNKRDYDLVALAGRTARTAVNPFKIDFNKLCEATNLSYKMQLGEGMKELPDHKQKAKKYCGGGFGGYALYIFATTAARDKFLALEKTVKIEPYLKQLAG
jgi:cytidyltransferase-like protein